MFCIPNFIVIAFSARFSTVNIGAWSWIFRYISFLFSSLKSVICNIWFPHIIMNRHCSQNDNCLRIVYIGIFATIANLSFHTPNIRSITILHDECKWLWVWLVCVHEHMLSAKFYVFSLFWLVELLYMQEGPPLLISSSQN